MKNNALLIGLCLLATMSTTSVPARTTPSVVLRTVEKHHVMWTTPKGKEKCCTKKSKEMADRCAEKLRRKKKLDNVQVMAGACKSM